MQHNNLSLQYWRDRLTVFWILGQEKTIKGYWNEKIYWDIMLDYIWLKINFRSNSSSKRRKSSGLTRETLLKTNSIRSVSLGLVFGPSHVEELGPGIDALRIEIDRSFPLLWMNTEKVINCIFDKIHHFQNRKIHF